MTEGILLAVKPAQKSDPSPDDDPVETIVAQLERDWGIVYPLVGSWYDHPSCLEPVEDEE